MTLRTLAIVAALWLACAASALAQGNDSGNPEVISDNDVKVKIDDASPLAEACQEMSGNEGKLYYLDADIETDGEFIVKSCLKLDLNGHSITSSANTFFYISNNATLMIVDRSTGGQKGSINCNNVSESRAIWILNGAKLIADGVTITCANFSAIDNYSGTAEFTNCTVSGVRSICNHGMLTVTGGSISGTETAILNEGGSISINTGENPAACTIGSGEWGISNRGGGDVTLGSGVSIANCTKSGISNSGGTFTLNAWPTFSASNTAGVSDILLYQGQKITIGSAITAAPAKKISVRVTDNNENDLTVDDLPVTITSGYASHVIDGSSNVIDPAEVFTYNKSDAGFAVVLGGDNKSEAVLTVDPATAPVGYDLTSVLSPTASGNFNVDWEFEMPDYDVLVYFVYEDLFDPVTFAFAEGQEWMTWCSEASFTKPDGIDAYTIDDATPEAITVTPITASDASQPAVLPAYTPLLLRKNGDNGLTAKQYAVPTAPNDDLFKDYGIVSDGHKGCTVYGATKAVTDAASSQVFALGRTYMLRSGEFVAVDQFDGIAANRCWLTLSGTPAASRLLIRTGDATDIRTVGPGPAPSDDHWYSLTGIRLEKRPDRKGIYLNGGKKVIIK